MTADPNTCTSKRDWLAIARLAVWNNDCQQIPHELATLLALLESSVRPERVLEIGAWRGGSAWAWSQLPSVSQVVSVTLPDGPAMATTVSPGCRWDIIRSDSQLDSTRDAVKAALGGRRAGLVFIDADHHYAAAKRDWQLYGPLCEAGGLVVFHDINDVPQHPEIDVAPLWAELAATHTSLALVAHPGELGGTGILLR